MAGICTRYNDKPNTELREFICDTVDEVNDLPTTTEVGKGVFKDCNYKAPMGSTCIVGNNGTMKTYLLFSSGWQEV